jgi:hypothetical protein
MTEQTERERVVGLCPQIEDHAWQPEGYIAWHSWAADMAKTHDQRKCPGCGLYQIWEPRGDHLKGTTDD